MTFHDPVFLSMWFQTESIGGLMVLVAMDGEMPGGGATGNLVGAAWAIIKGRTAQLAWREELWCL